MQFFGLPWDLLYWQVEVLAAAQLCTIWDASIRSSPFGYLSCLPHGSQPEMITVLQFHSALNECHINWQEGKNTVLIH